MLNIKLFVCCHQQTEVPKHPLLVPIQTGAALSSVRFPGFLQDNTGDNISSKNRAYCELTAQYWAWKNIVADYYGFFHYRRYLYPDVQAGLPYRIECRPAAALLDRLGYGSFPELIRHYDVILPKGENMYIPVREQYAKAPFHHRRDLRQIEEIIQTHYPEYTEAIEQYLSNSVCYFGNIFIMRRDIFCQYCAWLFSIMDEFDASFSNSGYTAQEQRVNGYLAERLLGIYVTQMRSSARILELPRVHFANSSIRMYQKRAINWVLPPGSRRRAMVKQILF